MSVEVSLSNHRKISSVKSEVATDREIVATFAVAFE